MLFLFFHARRTDRGIWKYYQKFKIEHIFKFYHTVSTKMQQLSPGPVCFCEGACTVPVPLLSVSLYCVRPSVCLSVCL